ncbi:MAG: hypothetical protein P1Q69_01720 [Candidatus Thorarchaeota archaeon]|nr:hypothetical protein [Candidatus Thorarchaeota archaeon]
METTTGALHYGKDWHQMLKFLADSEHIVDIYLCANAFGNIDHKPEMVEETHGVRVIYVGEDYVIVGPRRPVHSSIIPLGWISMIRIRQQQETEPMPELVGEDLTPLSEGVSKELGVVG